MILQETFVIPNVDWIKTGEIHFSLLHLEMWKFLGNINASSVRQKLEVVLQSVSVNEHLF